MAKNVLLQNTLKGSGISGVFYSKNPLISYSPYWLFGPKSSPYAALWNSTNTAPDLTCSANGRFISGRVYNNLWNDIAECVPSDGTVDVREIAMVDFNSSNFQVTKYDNKSTDAIVGIISSDPGMIVGYNRNYKDLRYVALKGMIWLNLFPEFNDYRLGDTVCIYRSEMFVRRKLFSVLNIFRIRRLFGHKVLGTIIKIDKPNNRIKLFV